MGPGLRREPKNVGRKSEAYSAISQRLHRLLAECAPLFRPTSFIFALAAFHRAETPDVLQEAPIDAASDSRCDKGAAAHRVAIDPTNHEGGAMSVGLPDVEIGCP